MSKLAVVGLVLVVAAGIYSLLALGVEFVWDSVSPSFYPDMPFGVAFVAVVVLSAMFGGGRVSSK